MASSDYGHNWSRIVEDQAQLNDFWGEWHAAQQHFIRGSLASGSDTKNRAQMQHLEHPAREEETSAESDVDDQLAALLPPVEGGAIDRGRGGADSDQNPGKDSRKLYGSISGGTCSQALDEGRRPMSTLQLASGDNKASASSFSRSNDATQRREDERKRANASRLERESELQTRIEELEAKLTETEALFSSDTGQVIINLEKQLAKAKLSLANTEEERDELEVKLLNVQEESKRQEEQRRRNSWFSTLRDANVNGH